MPNKCTCGPQPLGGENSAVFCSGPLLDAVQRSNMFPDSKTFVDMSCIYPPGQTLEDFEMFSNCRRNDGSMKFLQMFVEKHFNEPGSELEPWTPPDWKERPPFLAKICDPKLKEFGSKVNKLWKDLGRRVKEDVKENPDHYSLIYLPKPFIVPNANSREYRYWDSFWIVRGLLHSGMYQTARGMIDNYLALVRQYGFVPGCGRIYCAGRSNPPLLIMMVKAYVEVTKDDGYATHALPLLEIEFETFVKNHAVQVKGRTMYQYRDSSQGPRPEAYMDDLESVEHIESQEEKQALYTELKSACESGMEFSSRWFVALDGSNRGTISDTKTSAIVPVELNAIVFRSGKILSEFHRKFGNSKKAEDYQDRACGLVKSIRDVFWNDDAGIWLDYDLVNEQPRNYFCCTNFSPLWARAFPLADTDKVSQGVMKYIETNKLDDMYGGVPNTLNKQAGQKWDYPNAFPPMMFMIIEGLFNLGTPESKEMSKKWAHRWVKSNYTAYKYEDFMFEKYYCKDFGTAGSVDSKRIPLGYGWTNGVAIELLSKHGKDISMDDNKDEATNSKRGLEENDTAKQGKEEYIITSEANMEETSSSPANKKSTSAAPSCCASTVHGFQEQQPQRAGAVGGSCSCDDTQPPAPPTPPQSQEGNCACPAPAQQPQGGTCGAGGGGQQPQQQQQQQPQQQPQPCVITLTPVSKPAPSRNRCSCGHQQQQRQQQPQQRQPLQPVITVRSVNQTLTPYSTPTSNGNRTPAVSQHALGCPCYKGESKQQQQQQKQTQGCGRCATCGSPKQTQAPGTFGASQQQMQTQAPQDGGCGICGAPQQQKKTQAPQAGGCACGSPEQKNQTQAPQGGGGGTFGASQQQMQTQAPQGGGCGICGAPPQQKQTQAQTQGGGGGTGGASQQQMQTQASQGGGCVISGPLPPPPPRQQTQQTDPQGCECSDSSPQTKPQPQSCPEDCGPDERELQKIEQMKKMQDCKEKQIQELKERQAQIQKQQEGAQSSDCKESKDEKQDCTASLKTGQKAGCACSGQEEEDEDEKFQRQQEERTGQYSPLADPVDKKESRGNQQVKSSPGDCSCSNATGAAPEKQMSSPEPCPLCSKCPNCGSTYGQGQTKTVGTNRPSIPSENDDKDCGCENKSGAGSTPAQPGKPTLCGPCGIHLTKDFPTDKGPAPQYNKQFPLRDGDQAEDCSANDIQKEEAAKAKPKTKKEDDEEE